MIDRELLCKRINSVLTNNISKSKIQREWSNILYDDYNIPASLSTDVITLRNSIEEQTDFILFCFADIFNISLNKYFAKSEITKYKDTKYIISKFSFPIKWDMIQISDNQWIGKITAQELMKLRDAQLIKYNENTQRTLTRHIVGGDEVYSISLNKKAVSEIMKLYESNLYIPNTITLNLPEESDYLFDGRQLIIKHTDGFDILDGYHRYIGMSNEFNLDSSFDYPMELRVIVFEEERAKQFIFQEDQKTKMNKVDSNSFNQNNPANQITQALNNKPIITGLIGNNNSIINSSIMSNIIEIVYFKNVSKANEKKRMIEVRNKLYNQLLELIEVYPELTKNKWDKKFIAWVIILSEATDDVNKIYELANKYVKETPKEVYGIFLRTKMMDVTSLNRMKKIYEKEV